MTVVVDFRIRGKPARIEGLFCFFSRRGAENTQAQGTSNEGQGKTKDDIHHFPFRERAELRDDQYVA